MAIDGNTEHVELFSELKKEFETTIMQELIPGILHNFANPLNGVLGRAQLLQKRVYTEIKEAAVGSNGFKNHEKILNDVDLITEETDRLFSLFNDLSAKVYNLQDTATKKINISDLIKTETDFFDFYLDFKHSIEKKLMLERNIPVVTGILSEYSIAFSTIIRYSMNSMKTSPTKKLTIITHYDKPDVCVKIEDTGIHTLENEKGNLLDSISPSSGPFYNLDKNTGLLNALSLLKKYGAKFHAGNANGIHTICVKIPC